VIGGIIISIVLAALFFNFISKVIIEKHKQVSKESFSTMVNTINSLCGMNVGQSMTKTLTFSDIVEEVYAFGGRKTVVDRITVGDYLCMNITNKVTCERTECPVEMIYISHEEKVLGLVNRLLGRFGYNEYQLRFLKTECGTSILKPGMKTSCICDWGDLVSLITCQDQGENKILVTEDKTVILTDITPWIDATPEMLTLAKNVANNLSGSKILIVWEDTSVDPTFPSRSQMITSLENEGFQVTTFRHSTIIPTLDNYDQIWLLNPGWCEHPGRKNSYYCSGTLDWKESEIRSVGKAVEEGKGLFLITDSGVIKGKYQDIAVRVFNRILETIGYTFKQIPGCRCGCETPDVWSTQINDHELTKGIDDFRVKAVALLGCEYKYKVE